MDAFTKRFSSYYFFLNGAQIFVVVVVFLIMIKPSVTFALALSMKNLLICAGL